MSIAVKMSQNNANDKSFANTLNIWILQHNCARSMQIMHACMKFMKNKTDIVILQESWMKDENITILHSSFICIKSNVQNTWIKVLIFVVKNAKKFTCTSRSDIVFFFKFYVLMQFMTMKHDAIYLNSCTEALYVS